MINLNQVFTQLALRKIALFCSSTNGNDLYFLKEFIDIMINVVGEERLINMLKEDSSEINKNLGENWIKVKLDLKKFDKIVEKTKASYDLLEDKTMDKKDLKYKDFSEKARKIPLIKQDIYTLFVFLINNTSISQKSIPPEMFKLLDFPRSRAIGELDKRRVGDPIPERFKDIGENNGRRM